MTNSNIQIIIPMTGSGTRFRDAGFETLKPFIPIHNKPMIEWVITMFPSNASIFFICRETHIKKNTYIQETLSRIAPHAQQLVIKEDIWEKKGPVYSVMQVEEHIKNDSPVLISYCDYYMHWNYEAFISQLNLAQYDGAIPCYSGFHPHLLPHKNLYASCKVDRNDNLIEIKEKFSWEQDKTKSRHSPGLYYFKSGSLLKKYCKKLIEDDINIQGEYYMSLPFNYLVEDGLKVWCPVNISHFCQWGTPKDLAEYLFWISTLQEKKEQK